MLDSQKTIFSNSETDRANNQFATAIYKRHGRLRTGGGVDSPQWQWHLPPEPVVSSCGPVASLQTIQTNRVESVSGARMQAIFVMLNHKDMCHEKIRWSSLQMASRQQKSELGNRNFKTSSRHKELHFYGGKSAGEKPLGRPKRWWQNTPTDLMFFWPCIMNWLYINYQLDALIIIYS